MQDLTEKERPGIRRRVAALSPQQRALLAARLGLSLDRPTRRSQGLIGFVSGQPDVGIDTQSVREFLQLRLPDYMVPQVLHVLDSLPRTLAGKVDRSELAINKPAPSSLTTDGLVQPRNEIESILAAVWRDVLGVSELSVEDDFFELGGDSLLSIRILSRARQRGLQINPENFFAYPTIAGQAAAVGEVSAVRAETGIITGTASLTPIQHWFLRHISVDPQHWNQSILLSIKENLDDAVIERALQQILIHHDGLRLNLESEGVERVQRFSEPLPEPPLTTVDLSSVSSVDPDDEIDAAANRVHKGFDLMNGPLLEAVLFKMPAKISDRLLLVAHHLLVDAVSWQILIEDLSTVCEQLNKGSAMVLPAKTSSLKTWANRLATYSASDQVVRQLPWWLARAGPAEFVVPVDFDSAPDDNRVSSVATAYAELQDTETALLVNELPQAYHTQVMDVLLAALVAVIARWTDREVVQIDVERHGRQSLFEDIDVSRTVGWFTSVFPLWLKYSATGDPGEGIKVTKEALRSVPDDGIGHGLLGYLSPDMQTRAAVQTLPRSQICFNYLGRRQEKEGLFTICRENVGADRSPNGLRAYLLDINVRIASSRLQMHWSFSRRFHDPATINRLAGDYCAELRALIKHCMQPETGGHTPSDFPLADLDQTELDGLSQLLEQMDGEGQTN